MKNLRIRTSLNSLLETPFDENDTTWVRCKDIGILRLEFENEESKSQHEE